MLLRLLLLANTDATDASHSTGDSDNVPDSIIVLVIDAGFESSAMAKNSDYVKFRVNLPAETAIDKSWLLLQMVFVFNLYLIYYGNKV